MRAALKAAGVDAKDVLVDRLTTGPRSAGLLSYKSGRDDGTGLHRAMSVTVRDLGRYEEVLMALLETGVAKVKGVELQSLAIKHHRGEARTSALLIAREKAQAMAAVMSRKVEDVVTIEERSALIAVTRPRPGFTFGEEPIGDEAWVMGSIAVRAAVEVTFSLS